MAKKSFGSDDDPISGGSDKAKALGVPSLQEVDAQVFGNGVIPDSGQQVARPINLDQISPDPTQPRREVPATVRNRARADGVAEWQMWHQMAERQAGHEIPLKTLLRGEGEGAEADKTGMPLVDGFMALVALAASIFDKGLVNPITVSPRGMDAYTIETGERRYQAYRLLYGVLGLKKFSKIVANKVAAVDVWRQAAENGSRKPLNAIGMARQIALLIMALNDDKTYEPFEAFAGQSDRLFYAQVADGITHRIPKGASEKILQATGLKSRSQIAHYRALLDIPDDVWQQADEDDWPEFKIRESVRPPQDMFTPVNISTPTQRPALNNAVIKQMRYQGKTVGYIRTEQTSQGAMARIQFYNPNGTPSFQHDVPPSELQDIPAPSPFQNPSQGIRYNDLPTPPYAPPAQTTVPLAVGQYRRNPQGKRIKVLSVLNGLCSVAEMSPTTDKPLSTFSMNAAAVSLMPLIDTAAPVPAIQQHIVTKRLYLIVAPLQGGLGRVIEVDAERMPVTGEIEALTLADLRPYDGAQATGATEDERPPAIGDFAIYHATRPDGSDREEGVVTRVDWDASKGDYLVCFVTDRQKIELFAAKQLSFIAAPADPLPAWVKVGVRAQGKPTPWDKAYDGTIHKIYVGGGGTWAVGLNIGKMVIACGADELVLINEHELPAWAVDGAQVETLSGKHGVIVSTEWDENLKIWKAAIENKYGTQTYPLTSLMPLHAPVDDTAHDPHYENQAAPIVDDDLPEWAAMGATVVHKETGQICDVLGTGRDDEKNLWLLRVSIRGIAGEHDAPVRDFDLIAPPPPFGAVTPAAPRERHPALNPKNMNGVIVQQQHELGSLERMADTLKMTQLVTLVMAMRIVTAEGLKTRLKQSSHEQVKAWLDTLYKACMDVLQEMVVRLDTVYTNAIQVLDELDNEKHGT